jgi:hypothetical protein
MYRHLLVHVGHGEASFEAVAHAAELAQAIGARITFLHPVDSGEGAPHKAGAVSAEARAGELLARAEATARAQGVACSSAAVSGAALRQGWFSEARERGCDLVCVAPAECGTAAIVHEADVAGTQGLPVLVTPVDRRPAAARVSHALFEDYRAIADELHAWLEALEAARSEGTRPASTAMRSIIRRLGERLARLRAREEALFATLRERISIADAELDELERRHERDEERLAELARIIGQDAERDPAAGQAAHAVSAYAKFVWEWMGREAGVILPAARRYLSDADWMAIETQSRLAA